MATENNTVAEKLKKLFELQQIDSELDQIEVLKGELPIEVSDLEDTIAGLDKRVNKLQGEIDELNDTVSGHEAAIKEAESLIERYNTQLDNVKNNREYDALTKELEIQKLDIQLAEKRIREANVTIAGKEETLGAAQERLDKKKKDLEIKKVELEEISAATAKKEKELRAASEKKRKGIEDRLINAYDRIRERYRNGLAVVTVERDSCGGCFNQIPPQVQLEISMRKNIIACEHCGRVLVDDHILTGEPQEKEKA
jgi:predicted  nucleic acid-binding Zn-ribbon protein